MLSNDFDRVYFYSGKAVSRGSQINTFWFIFLRVFFLIIIIGYQATKLEKISGGGGELGLHTHVRFIQN